MGPPARDMGKPAAKEHRLGDPIAFFHLDHLREREICTILDRIARDRCAAPGDVSDALTFLREEFPLHLADEEEDLFPLLRQSCAPEDEIDKAITRLLSDHGDAKERTPDVVAILDRLEDGASGLSDEERAVVSHFTTHARRHLVLENAIILPFARLRLSAKDRDGLLLRMLERRGLDRLWEPSIGT